MIPFGRAARAHFLLEGDAVFLNHGSYGATPRVVLAAADAWRRRMEAQPVRFMGRELIPALHAALDRLGGFIGARGADLAFVDNATAAVSTVLRAFELAPGDELLTTSHAYGAVRAALGFVAARAGARVVEAELPFPAAGEDELCAALARRFTERTRLLALDHVTSPTALVLPVARLAAAARARGIPVLVDGAHAPGMLNLDIGSLGVDWYAGNCHKWLFAPKGCAFLWAAPERQAVLAPLAVSHGQGQGFRAAFDWTGTRDHSAFLAVTAALGFIEGIGAERLRARNHDLVVAAARLIVDAWWTPVGGPPALLGAMAAIAVPTERGLAKGLPATPGAAAALHDRLWDDHRIEVPVTAFAGRLWVRVSAQIYNELEEYHRLAEAVLKELPPAP